MGYRIDYLPVRKLRNQEKRRNARAALTGLFFVAFLLGIRLLWPEAIASLRELVPIGQLEKALETFSQEGKQVDFAGWLKAVSEGFGFAAD